MKFTRRFMSAALACVLALPAAAADLPTLKASVLKIGTVNWELATITSNGFDEANGFKLDVQGMADNGATRVAFAGGEADIVVADWIWVATQRAAGKDYVFIPYSTAVGGIVVGKDSAIQSLEDIKGAKIGIAGGPVDKSWLILQAYAQKKYGFDLAAETEQAFGAPPLIMKSAFSGEVDGAINFWHFLAKMKAAGMREIISVAEAAEYLGLDPQTPLLGYVVKGEMVRDNPEVVAGLARASRAAKDLLASDPAAWEAIRDRMNAKDDGQFEALKTGWIAGIPANADVDEDAARAMYDVMVELGGEKLVGDATEMPDGVFLNSGM